MDVNIIISALIKDSITRKILVESTHAFFIPEIAFEKVDKYMWLIVNKSKLSPSQITLILNVLKSNINIIKTSRIKENISQAKLIMDKIDPEDTIFIAASLSIPNSIIWSDDKHFKQQNEVKTITTKEMINL